jgi:hypothetical protein
MTPTSSVIEQILNLARWAPSGDNTQPWRFEVLGNDRLVVHGFDTRDHCVYDIDGHPSQIALGALLETLAIAASAHGLATRCDHRAGLPDATPTFDVRLAPDGSVRPSPLLPFVATRTVHRRPLSTRPLTAAEKAELAAAVGEAHAVRWLESPRERWRVATLLFRNAGIRLTIPEAYRVHRDIIEWGAQFSEDRVPDQALGLDRATLKIMRWVMQSWERVRFFNRYLAGTLAPRLQMDLIPGVACAAHFLILAAQPAETIDDFVAAGRATQRLWLTAARLGLQLQPEQTPLIFAGYARAGRHFSNVGAALEQARELTARLDALVGETDARRTVFMARLGHGNAAEARSLRLPLARLRRDGGP